MEESLSGEINFISPVKEKDIATNEGFVLKTKGECTQLKPKIAQKSTFRRPWDFMLINKSPKLMVAFCNFYNFCFFNFTKSALKIGEILFSLVIFVWELANFRLTSISWNFPKYFPDFLDKIFLYEKKNSAEKYPNTLTLVKFQLNENSQHLKFSI